MKKDNDMEKLKIIINKFLMDNVGNVGMNNPISVHFDELLKGIYDSKNIVNQVLEAYTILINTMKVDVLKSIMPIVVIPLNPIERIDFSIVGWHNCEANLSDEPPLLYLQSRESLKLLEIVEEYKVPLLIPNVDTMNREIISYFRIFRNKEAYENNWEYERCIYIECYVKPYF
ncbi:MAG: hypothetical protein GX639_11530 [Fibrobacter sp.]|nr:hypothetical protein [Fibrobacter sp.]